MNRRPAMFWALLPLLPRLAAGQLALSLNLDHTRLLKHEPASATVTVQNESDVPFVIRSAEEDPRARLRLMIRTGPDRYAARLSDRPLVAELALLPGERQALRVEFTRWYDVAEPQGYDIWAVVDWNGVEYKSGLLHFEVLSGLPLKSVSRGLPGEADRARRYALRYLARDGKERLFLCIDEEDGLVNCGVFDLGPLVRAVEPQLEVDRLGTVRVAHLAALDRYVTSVLKSWPDRVTLVDQTVRTQRGEEVRPLAAETP